MSEDLRVSRSVRLGHRLVTVEADTSPYADVNDGLTDALRRLDAAAERIANGCPECYVGVGEPHAEDCPLRGEG